MRADDKKYQRADEFELAKFLIAQGNTHRAIGGWLNVPFRTIGNWHRGKCRPTRRLPDEGAFEAQCVPEPNTGCLLWTGSSLPAGYGHFRHRVAHRYSWEQTFGPIPEGLLVCHKCDTPACVNPDHLFLGTDLDNARDKIAKGRAKHGEQHPLAISRMQARRIKELRRAGCTHQSIADDIGCATHTVGMVLSGNHWSERP